ncbi:MAG: TIGR02147 family protein, partial [Deltaproteobacteria bacterium]|nr:TIGR02147 family protein [Deltaproteobacteria bacterium]
MNLVRPKIYHYLSYREFLKDLVAYEKNRTNSKFSYRNFSRLAGLKSISYLKLVLDGERNLSADTMHGFAKAFKIKGEEREFFELLVNFDQ